MIKSYLPRKMDTREWKIAVERRRQLAMRPPPARPTQRVHIQLGLQCEHT
jgi:hypothetical protein